jgi:exodeoxyribonuclease VII small subunit
MRGFAQRNQMPRTAPTPMPPPKAAQAAAGGSDPPSSYEDALAELEHLVQQMEAGQLPLDRLLDSYRRGAVLLDYCRQRLQAVEQQVKVLDEGQLKDWTA